MSLSIGERLKSARNAKGVSIEAVAKATKIQRKILEAMEEDRVEEILDWAYAKIFMKKYASYLDLDGAVVVEEYLASHAPSDQYPRASLETPSPKFSGTPLLPRILIPAGLGLLGLTGLSFLGYLVMDLYGNLKENRRAAQAASSPSGPRTPTVERVPSAPKLIVPLSVPLKLTVSTKADVWMQVKSDGTVIFQNVLPKGSKENWTAKEELELWTGNAGAMELSLNGRPLGNPGSGVKKGIKITHEGLRMP